MARIRPVRPAARNHADAAERVAAERLAAIGLSAGQSVRFRKIAGGHWLTGSLTGIEADGSLAITDERGRARSIPLDQVEVRGVGPRGGVAWESAAAIASRDEQLHLFS